ncbi:flagellar brake protein [Aestuariirhabdus sp. Z084]|uniref:flagellar brake protein n=1 Tax=Aestuariirhabdus haliotis TaxID=2918751 RepID=UPI00201B3A61|nr:flagellar brake protein [Aestuariirhabdus haliotis]MCL6414919.1 flagellar brake protein [Aestuariirhabdus haliotis]MCL6418851.1 flagellar brake protein [Aestuariirhabdus haliotis]
MLDKLKLLPGLPLQLQFHHTEDIRERSRLVGYLSGTSIIVTTPMSHGAPRPVRPHDKVNVRFFSNETNSAVGFSTEVIHVSMVPFPNLHLSYPESVATDEIRRSVRIDVQEIASVVIKGEKVPTTIVDLSTGGCRIESRQKFASAGDSVTITVKLEVAGISRVLNLSGEVRTELDSYRLPNSTAAYGVLFGELEDEDQLLLHAYVYSNMR